MTLNRSHVALVSKMLIKKSLEETEGDAALAATSLQAALISLTVSGCVAGKEEEIAKLVIANVASMFDEMIKLKRAKASAGDASVIAP